jgi:hypothetical protein
MGTLPKRKTGSPALLLSALLIGAVCTPPAKADQPFYRCIVNGKTTYTDKPCQAPTLTGSEAVQNTPPGKAIPLDYTTPYGAWRGQAQYQGTVKGQPLREAHVVVPLVIELEKQGRVRGASPENGCNLLGVAAPMSANLLTLDVTLTNCRFPALNRRYSGTLALYQTTNSVQFSLQSFNHGLAAVTSGQARFDVSATMRR